MARWSGTPSRSHVAEARAVARPPAGRQPRRTAIEPYERSCCCSAPPIVRAVFVASSPAVHSVDLLLCGHHYRVSAATLSSMAAMIFDRQGYLIALDESIMTT